MKVEVKYHDYIETIDEVKLVINSDQQQVLKLIEKTVGEEKEVNLQIETIDDTISFSVTQELSYDELRNYVKILQSLIKQMLNTKN